MDRLNHMPTGMVKVWQFEHGHQGHVEVVEEVTRTIHHTVARWPRRTLCSDLPLEKQTFYWIEYRGRDWPVRRSVGDTHWELFLPSKEYL